MGFIMKLVFKKIRLLSALALFVSLSACTDKHRVANMPISEDSLRDKIALDVYTSPTCGCCEKWVSHVEAAGFEAAMHHPSDLNKLKDHKGVLPHYQSCHTADTQEGYVFEGHIPADVIKRFLTNPPADSLGLAVPGMPVGSPGMEMGNRHDKYDVLLLSKDGSSTVFEHIAGNN
jgi:hypothetical protein